MSEQLAGYCSVDSGQILICDPCYIGSDFDTDPKFAIVEKPKLTYDGCCDVTVGPPRGEAIAGQLYHARGHEGAGVAMSAGYGDGVYPVFVTYAANGRVREARIVFFEDEDEDE